MILDAIVKDDGMLIIKTPRSLWGKKVKVHVQAKRRKTTTRKVVAKPESVPITEDRDHQASLAQWEKMKAILQASDQLELPRRTIDEILHDLHELRES